MNRIKARHLLVAAVVFGVTAFALSRLIPGGIPRPTLVVLYGTALLLAFAALLRGNLPGPCDAATPTLRRRYTRELMLAMASYVMVLFVSIWLLKRIEEPALRALVALAPLPPIALAMRAIVRYIRDVDEMQQRIELEAVCIATAFVSLLYMAGGFLQIARVIAVDAGAAMIWVFPLVCLAYGLAKVVVLRRYR